MEKQTLYSIRMRAAVGGRHERGGKHISGGEQLGTKSEIVSKSQLLIEKALAHHRGEADFLQVTIEKVEEDIHYFRPLPVQTNDVPDETEGRILAKNLLKVIGLQTKVIDKGMAELDNCFEARGAIIVDANTGERLDGRGLKGVRVSRIDWEIDSYEAWLFEKSNLKQLKVKEALALATKVAAHPYTVAELCWSDDPDYVTGYVASQHQGYQRISKLKKFGDENGGRIYFVNLPSENDLDSYIHFLEKVPTIIKIDR